MGGATYGRKALYSGNHLPEVQKSGRITLSQNTWEEGSQPSFGTTGYIFGAGEKKGDKEDLLGFLGYQTLEDFTETKKNYGGATHIRGRT